MKFPKLFKKTSTGAIQFWQIETSVKKTAWANGQPLDAGIITTTYGQEGTDNPQVTTDCITIGKNEGKKNGTTPVQQAELEAKAKYDKQLKKGYVESIEDAQGDKVDDLIEGGVLPMLAHTFEKQGKKVKYPCYVQPKLDGIRCIAIVKNGKCTLWSRTRKLITSCPHIINEIEKNFKEDIVLDGELYSDEFRDNFEHIVHLVRQQEPDPEHTDVHYHIYDLVNSLSFDGRCLWLAKKFSSIKSPNFEYLTLVNTYVVETEDQVSSWFSEFKDQGYEGCMLRNSNGLYTSKRSVDLIKVKEMQDDEFEIVGIEEGRGKLQGHVGSFICRTKSGTEFNAKMSGDTGRLREYFCDHTLWKGRYLTVQFQDLTGKEKVPRFPVGKAIRDYE